MPTAQGKISRAGSLLCWSFRGPICSALGPVPDVLNMLGHLADEILLPAQPFGPSCGKRKEILIAYYFDPGKLCTAASKYSATSTATGVCLAKEVNAPFKESDWSSMRIQAERCVNKAQEVGFSKGGLSKLEGGFSISLT